MEVKFLSLPSKKEAKVPLDNDVILNCKCGVCPVQGYSACSTPYIQKTINSRAEVYCSAGKADCKDLDISKACICNQCQVYQRFNLFRGSPVEHFCFNGKAK